MKCFIYRPNAGPRVYIALSHVAQVFEYALKPAAEGEGLDPATARVDFKMDYGFTGTLEGDLATHFLSAWNKYIADVSETTTTIS